MSPTFTTRFIRIAAVFGAVLISSCAFAQTSVLKKPPTKPVRVAARSETPKKATPTAKTSRQGVPNLATVSGLKAHIATLEKKYRIRSDDALRDREERDRLLSEGKRDEAEELKREDREKRMSDSACYGRDALLPRTPRFPQRSY